MHSNNLNRNFTEVIMTAKQNHYSTFGRICLYYIGIVITIVMRPFFIIKKGRQCKAERE